MRKIQCFAMVFMFFASVLFIMPNDATASYARIGASTTAKVVEIVDGDTLTVQLSNGQFALVRMIGIMTRGYDAAYQYLLDNLLGKQVELRFDDNVERYTGRYNNMYVYLVNELYNRKLLSLGLAEVNPEHKNASVYSTMLNAQTSAKTTSSGMWSVDEQYYFSTDKININTASAALLKERLYGISDDIANHIVAYRKNNPFNNAEEIKFVAGLTRSLYLTNRNKLSVYTNVNKASEYELVSLGELSLAEANAIISYRNENKIKSMSELVQNKLISSSLYNTISQFVGLESLNQIDSIIPNRIIYINVASESRLTAILGSSKKAKALIEYRKDYCYKTVEELMYVPGLALTRDEINSLEDNFKCNYAIDINSVSLTELTAMMNSLGYYDTDIIKKMYNARPYTSLEQVEKAINNANYKNVFEYIRLDGTANKNVYININFASRDQLIKFGFTEAQAAKIIAKQGQMTHSGDIPVELGELASYVCLYTNINKADEGELMSLHTVISADMIKKIIDYRKTEPFASAEEVKDFFDSISESGIYSIIKKFIVVR